MAIPFPGSSIPSWKLKVLNIKDSVIDTTKEYQEQFKYGDSEVGMKNPNNDSHIKIYDNGDIEVFAGDASGIMISDANDTVNLYGYAVNINSQNTNVTTRPYGLTWNGYIANPTLYQLCNSTDDLRVVGVTKYWVPPTEKEAGYWADREVRIRPFMKAENNPKYQTLLSDLGIPT